MEVVKRRYLCSARHRGCGQSNGNCCGFLLFHSSRASRKKTTILSCPPCLERENGGGGVRWWFCVGHDNNDEQKSITLLPATRAASFLFAPVALLATVSWVHYVFWSRAEQQNGPQNILRICIGRSAEVINDCRGQQQNWRRRGNSRWNMEDKQGNGSVQLVSHKARITHR